MPRDHCCLTSACAARFSSSLASGRNTGPRRISGMAIQPKNLWVKTCTRPTGTSPDMISPRDTDRPAASLTASPYVQLCSRTLSGMASNRRSHAACPMASSSSLTEAGWTAAPLMRYCSRHVAQTDQSHQWGHCPRPQIHPMGALVFHTACGDSRDVRRQPAGYRSLVSFPHSRHGMLRPALLCPVTVNASRLHQ